MSKFTKVTSAGQVLAGYQVMIKTIASIIVIAITFGLGILGASFIVVDNGYYTISIEKISTLALSLSETPDFEKGTTNLTVTCPSEMTNISESKIASDVDEHDGSHNGEYYIAYTFYIMNVGTMDGVLTGGMTLTGAVLNADDAIRVRVYEDGVMTTYAKPKPDGTPEADTQPFSDDTVFWSVTNPFKTNQIKKFTIVVWLDGYDDECLDNIIGGNVGFSVDFSIELIDGGEEEKT